MLRAINSSCLMLAPFACLCRLFFFSLLAFVPPPPPPLFLLLASALAVSLSLSLSRCRDCLVFTLPASELKQLTLMKLLHLLVCVGL